jgi:3-deoxy-D-manno-octulosonic-acid transferase
MDRVREGVEEVRLVVAPHEPEPEHVRGLLAALRERGWRSGTLAEAEGGGVGGLDAVVVDRVGVLAHLYTVGMAAYVGGGFGDDGLHSVLEPAAAALPVAFGPGTTTPGRPVTSPPTGAGPSRRTPMRWPGS